MAKKRVKTTKPVAEEFMPGETVTTTTESPKDEIDLRVFARDLLDDPAVRAAVTWRAREGKLSASEFGWLREQASRAPTEKKKSEDEGWQRMMETASEAELAIVANMLRRCEGQPEESLLLSVRGRRVGQRDFLESMMIS